jgi:beta-N-acetylhexosaminidase
MNDATMRAGLIAASVLVAAAAVLSLAHPNSSAAPGAAPRTVAASTRPTPIAAPSVDTTASPSQTITVPTTPAVASAPTQPANLARMIGQQLMVGMAGTAPDSNLLERVHAGQVGGVIIYGRNAKSPAQLQQATADLQQAAVSGGNPRLLIATDQEEMTVRHIWWAPPTLTAPQLAAAGSAAIQNQGYETGLALRRVGVNMDLAPVLDVAHSSSVFIWQQERSYSMNPQTVTAAGSAFMYGLNFARVAATAKHFPGLGGVALDTDSYRQSVQLTSADLVPFSKLIGELVPAIMTSLATYTNYDPHYPAALSPRIVTGLLRDQLHYQGVVITDNLPGSTGLSVGQAAIAAEQAGDDIILASTSEKDGADAYNALLSAAEHGQLTAAQVNAAYQLIIALKQKYANP